MKKINILFLTIGRLTNINERGIYTDLVREFKNNNHNVFVVSPIERRENKKTYMYNEDGVTFLRVRTGNIKKNHLIEKGLNTILIEPLYKRAIKEFYKNIKFDLILYSTPPITFANVIDYIKKRDSAKTYLLLKDIFPQNAVDLKMIKENSIIHKFFKKKEKKLYQISDYIGCMSEANVDYILEKNKFIDIDKVEVNPNSISPIKISKNINKSIHEKFKIPEDKIKFIYGGSLGKPQDIPFLIECIRANENNPNIHFIVVGSGVNEELISNYYHKENNKNLTFIKYLPKSEYDDLIAIADVGMIFLSKEFTIPNFPSRLLSYMEAELPILSATDKFTDVGDVISENNFGRKCISDDVKNFNDILPYFYSKDKRELMGMNARKYLEENYTVEKSYAAIIKHFN